MTTAAFAATDATERNAIFSIQLGSVKEPLSLDDLPYPPYREGDVLMVPLRRVAEALGYQVEWNSKTGAITVDDGYIQKAVLNDADTAVTFYGHLKVINLSRTIALAVPAVIRDGSTYVPLDFFAEFFNDIWEKNGIICIAPSMCELDAAQ